MKMGTTGGDALGDRMKDYEVLETGRRLMPLLPIYARIDGRGFSKFTQGMNRPYDQRMIDIMVATAQHLVRETHALCGFTQSDEINLAWKADAYDSDIFFGGKIQKLASVLAGMATAAFTRALMTHNDPEFVRYAERLPHFDARVFSLPNEVELTNAFLWRSRDATKNAISMAARHYFSHSSLQNVSSSQMQEKLFQEKNINFNDFSPQFKRGTWVRRILVTRPLDDAERMKIPEAGRPAPDAQFIRSKMIALDLPPLSKVANRVDVIFRGADPIREEGQPAN